MQACQKCNLAVQGNNLRESNFWWRMNVFIISVLWLKTLRTFGEKGSEGLWKMNSTCPEELLMIFFWKVTHLFITCGVWVKNCQHFLAEKLCQACQKCNLCVQGYILGKNYFWKEYVIDVLVDRFWTSSDFFQNFNKNISVRLSKLHFTCAVEGSEQKHFSEKVYYYSFSLL